MKDFFWRKKRRTLFVSLFFISVGLFANDKKLNPKIDSLVSFARQYIGCQYQSGACGPNVFDCSGFTKYVFSQFGYTLNRTSSDQLYNGLPVKEKNARKGDLIFFKGSDVNSISIGHVGIIISEPEETPIQFIHVSISSGVRVDKLDDDYFSQRFISISRVIQEFNSENKEEKEDSKKEEKIIENDDSSIEYYIVKKGDTMYSLARKNNCSVDDVKRFNNLSNNDLRIGQKLIFTDKKNDSEKKEVLIEPDENTIYYVVRKGETLYRISKNNGCSVDELKSWNGLSDNKISVGQKLIIKR